MNDKVIIITLEDWVTIYFKGQQFAEGHRLPNSKWIRLGTLMQEANIDICDMIDIYLSEDDVTDETLLWSWPKNVNDLDDEIKNIIMKNIGR